MMKQHVFGLAAVVSLIGGLTLAGCGEDAVGLDDSTPSVSDTEALVSALSVPGEYDYGTWEDHYGNRKMAASGTLSTEADSGGAITGSYVCSGTSSCPAADGEWTYGQDGVRSRWVDFSAAGQTKRWTLAEDGRGRVLFTRTLGTKRVGWQRFSYGEMFLKR